MAPSADTASSSVLAFTQIAHPAPTPKAARDAVLAAPGFGTNFTDHMVCIEWNEANGWHDATIGPRGPIMLDPAASVLHYAQEIFEGLKAYATADGHITLFRPEANAARLNASARRLATGEVVFRKGDRADKLYLLATGRIERGIVHVGDTIEIVGMKPETESTVVTGVEMFRKLLDEGRAGDNVGCLLRGVKREDIERGQVLAQPKSITPHTKFVASVYVLSKDEGGRHTPFFGGYRPQFYFRTTDVTGVCTLESGVEMIMPGDNAEMEIELIQPIAMEDGLRFAIREGGRTVGAGVVSKILQ